MKKALLNLEMDTPSLVDEKAAAFKDYRVMLTPRVYLLDPAGKILMRGTPDMLFDANLYAVMGKLEGKKNGKAGREKGPAAPAAVEAGSSCRPGSTLRIRAFPPFRSLPRPGQRPRLLPPVRSSPLLFPLPPCGPCPNSLFHGKYSIEKGRGGCGARAGRSGAHGVFLWEAASGTGCWDIP